MGRFPITQAQWRAVSALPRVDLDLNPYPSYFKGNNRPVEQVSWHEAVEFCNRLSQKTSRQYCLPSEAEWEYACRAETITPFCCQDPNCSGSECGQTISTTWANFNGFYNIYSPGTVYKNVGRKQTTEVGSFYPNNFGLYDMHGNVFEWCQDHFHASYEGAPENGSAWENPSWQNSWQDNRIIRGGAWDSTSEFCRSACRCFYDSWTRRNNLGFRVVCVLA